MSDAGLTKPVKIGVFDSGVGGLTVLRALLQEMPEADYIYLGDTARLPYGSKSQKTIARYAVSSANFLLEQGAQFLVIACNTASALALSEIRAAADAFSVPVLGVVETGANAAAAHSSSHDVLVMATAATVASHAYAAECAKRGLRALEKACPLLVPLVEEGWVDHAVTEEVVDIYVGELLRDAAAAPLMPDTLVLGCTHYPLLREVITRAVPPALKVIDSAEVTAQQAAEMMRNLGKTHVSKSKHGAPASVAGRSVRFYATDSVEKFRALGERFLGQPIERVELVDLGG
jgi:glutamate racemase